MKNREIVSSLFFRRTGIKYQNWIQAWAVTKLQKQKKGIQNVIAIRYRVLPKMMINKADFVLHEAPHSWGFLFV